MPVTLVTYGSINFDDISKLWALRLQPHVAIKVKRLFGRIRKSDKVIVVQDSDEIRRDLQWIMARYPLEISHYDLGVLEEGAARFDQRIEDIQRILGGEIQARNFDLAFPARNYQATAAEVWLRYRSLLLADALGLGKTFVAIIGAARQEMQPALIVVEAHLQLQWASELRKFAPGIKVHILKSGHPYNLLAGEIPKNVSADQIALFKDDIRFPDVIISTYHKLSGWVDALCPIVKTVVWDEVQGLRRRESDKYRASERLAEVAEWRLGLSATPVFNYGVEMWNIMNVLNKGALGSLDEFRREQCFEGDKGMVKDPKAFGLYLRESGLMLRRTREEVGREIPPISMIPIQVQSDPKALDNLGNAAELAKIILAQESEWSAKGKAARELDWRLRQATGIAKAPYVAEFVKMLLESEEKILLAGWHRAVYDIWLHRLKEFHPVLYTGSESMQQKDAARRVFVNGNSRVFIISLRSGAGLDGLQKVCNVGVIGELDWSPEVHDQVTGRIYRDGQARPVLMYFPIADGGSDPVIADVLQLKKAQIVGIRDPSGDAVQGQMVSPDHIKMLAQHYLKSQEK